MRCRERFGVGVALVVLPLTFSAAGRVLPDSRDAARADSTARQAKALEALDASSTIPFFIADGTDRASGFRPGDRELARWALAEWQRHADALRFIEAPERDAVVRVYWADPTGGQYGEMRPLVVNGRRGAAVYIRPDMNGLGADIARLAAKDDLLRESIVYLTCLHELGHALGLPHTAAFDDIMYFFGHGGDIVEYFNRYRRQVRARGDIVRLPGASKSDVSQLRALYPAR